MWWAVFHTEELWLCNGHFFLLKIFLQFPSSWEQAYWLQMVTNVRWRLLNVFCCRSGVWCSCLWNSHKPRSYASSWHSVIKYRDLSLSFRTNIKGLTWCHARGKMPFLSTVTSLFLLWLKLGKVMCVSSVEFPALPSQIHLQMSCWLKVWQKPRLRIHCALFSIFEIPLCFKFLYCWREKKVLLFFHLFA